MTVSQSVVRHR